MVGVNSVARSTRVILLCGTECFGARFPWCIVPSRLRAVRQLRSRLAFLLRFTAVLFLACNPSMVQAQALRWSLQAEDGSLVPWPSARAWSPDSVRHAALDALHTLQAAGYYFARIDSHSVDRTARLFATRGPRVHVGDVRIEGTLDSLELKRHLTTRPGRILDPATLDADMQALVGRYAENGFLLAEIDVADITLMEGDPPRLRVTLRVREGPAPRLARVELPGASRTRPGYAARAAGLRPGHRLAGFDAETIRQRLAAMPVFRSVQEPELILEGDSMIVVRIPVEEEAPGAFDLALGYQPPPPGQRRGRLVGSGHLVLRNLFGGGRLLSLELKRPPGSVSRLDAHVSSPYVAGLPLSLEGRFAGLQQDSTYGKRTYGMEIGYMLNSGLHIFGTLHREVTRPGLAGLAIIDGVQRIALATSVFAGIGIRVRHLDNRINPRKGIVVETSLEKGRKRGQSNRAQLDGDPVSQHTVLNQERLLARFRWFVPIKRRHVILLGGEAYLLRSSATDEGDLFRFGGANSLRGYDEERFRTPFATRILLEYRYKIDYASFGLVFFDLGYVDASKTREALRGLYPGFGLGFQLGTDVGLITLSLGANTEDPTLVRAHIGLSVGV